MQVSRKKGSGGAALLAGVLLYGTLVSNRFGPAPVEGHPLNSPTAKIIGVAGITGLAQPAALAFLLCSAVLGLSWQATCALSWRGWRPIADVSYDIYLLHPMAMYAVWTVLPPSVWFDIEKPNALKFITVSSVVFWVSLGVATLHSKAWASMMRPHRRHCKV
jgi:peptidoglycan/LPS O-acetylase OafA/YrhL